MAIRRDICKRGHDLSGCIACNKIKGAERYAAQKESIQAYQRHWAKHVNPAAAKRSRWRQHLKKNYKITPEYWTKMFEAQKGQCAICHGPPLKLRSGRGGQGGFHVDHNHVTGEVRALLCQNCNHAVGAIRESPDLAEKLLRYLRKFSQLRLVS